MHMMHKMMHMTRYFGFGLNRPGFKRRVTVFLPWLNKDLVIDQDK